MSQGTALPIIVADGTLTEATSELLRGRVEILPWETLLQGTNDSVAGIYTFGHPPLDGALMDNVPNIKVISNYGVGVDHIRLPDAIARNIPVGNTPGVLDAATADLGFALMMATGRRLVEGDRFARADTFTTYRPGQILGREISGAKLGIIGMGRIGATVARRARAFDMSISYHNRSRRADVEQQLGVTYETLESLLSTADYIMLCVPLTSETTGLIGEPELSLMKPTATLVNIARGAVVDTDALTNALREKRIYAAGLDVTDPEPLPRHHALLAMENVVITPHLGSATVQTRQKMSELSVQNLMAGLAGEPLVQRIA